MERLNEIIAERNTSASALARRLGISRNRIRYILKGDLRPDYFTMKALRKALDIDPSRAAEVFFPDAPEMWGEHE